MFIRRVNGCAYLTETVRVGGRVVQRHLGRADKDTILMVESLRQEDEAERREKRQRREEELERDRELSEHWTLVREEFESSMRSAGFHNPNGRGWRKRRTRDACRQSREGGSRDGHPRAV
jgi:hypothetical protein